ncbi:unnamed protein product [Phytophthora lilii]|uniref:Unnamed protein product n=1 Tax=Phytophthora lilii TaxID=2077276 RepID=A0A9W6WN88_9STRA|nr:unnamed protein product [Phytophthora lilii]
MVSAATTRNAKWSTKKGGPARALLAKKQNPASAGLNLPKVVLISKEPALQSFLAKNYNKLTPLIATTVGVHFQFADSTQDELEQMITITISSDDIAVILQLATVNAARVISGLRALLSDSSVTKVMHNIYRAALWLHNRGIRHDALVKCVDLQLLYESFVGSTALNADALQITTHCSPDSATDLAESMHSFKARVSPSDWITVSLPENCKLR